MSRINYHHLYLFWTLAKQGSFTKAAESLSIAQSAVTSQIKQLEDALGLLLVDRSNRRKPILTEDGKSVLDFANSIFETGDELLKWTSQGSSQKNLVVRVGALSGLSRNFQFEFLRPIIGKAGIRIEIQTGDQEKLVKLLKEHHLDLILSSHNVHAEGRVKFYSHVLTTSPMVFVISKNHRMRGVGLKEHLKEKPLSLPGLSFETRPEIDAFLEKLRFPITILSEIDDIALLRIFALRAESVVLIPEMGILNEIRTGEVQVLSKLADLSQKFYAITRQKRTRNEIVEALISNMRE
jgi:LysR family transcriptional regulator, transcriptional activator of nhaA